MIEVTVFIAKEIRANNTSKRTFTPLRYVYVNYIVTLFYVQKETLVAVLLIFVKALPAASVV